MNEKDKKDEYLKFSEELMSLLKKHKVYLYAEDCYGAELTNIIAYKSGVFEDLVQTESYVLESEL